MKIFAERLRELREDKGLSQTKLAFKLGVSKSAVGFWENETNEPSISMLVKLAVFFDVSADYLLGLVND